MLKGYVTPVEVASIIGWDITDPQTMAEIPILLEFVEQACDDFCHTQFDWEEGVSKVFDGTGHAMITLGFYLRQLTAVWALDVNGVRITQLTDVVAQPTPLKRGRAHRWIERRQFNSRYKNTFPAGLGNIEVIGNWGFQPAEMPSAIKMACAFGVKHLRDTRQYNDLVELEAGLGKMVKFRKNESVQYLPEVSRRALAPWINSSAGAE